MTKLILIYVFFAINNKNPLLNIEAKQSQFLIISIEKKELTLDTKSGCGRVFAAWIDDFTRDLTLVFGFDVLDDQLDLVTIFSDTILGSRTQLNTILVPDDIQCFSYMLGNHDLPISSDNGLVTMHGAETYLC